MPRRRLITGFIASTLAALAACQSAYYSTMEAFGKHKRDLLAERVQAARTDQEEARDQFATALDRFSDLIDFSGGDLRKAYDRAESELGRSEARAADVSERIDSVQTVGEDLFEEWEKELAAYSSDDLRRQSRAQLRETRARYDDMLAAMRRAERAMQPVLSAFRDQVLLLKHNLNAQAVASMKGTLAGLEDEVADLIREIERSMAESDRFIREMATE